MSYYFNKTLSVSFDEAIAKVTEELKKEGFGILTEIDELLSNLVYATLNQAAA